MLDNCRERSVLIPIGELVDRYLSTKAYKGAGEGVRKEGQSVLVLKFSMSIPFVTGGFLQI